MSLSAGRKIGPYEIISILGAGGMGEVYRARDSRLGRDVALKILSASFSSDPSRLGRFEQEARAVAALNHPNILALFDIGTADGAPYIVSELLEGATLRERLADGPVAARKAVEMLAQIAEGLAAAHEKGVIHRDLKPDNIFITRDARVKILDFGLAKLVRSDVLAASADGLTAAETRHTDAGTVLGTAGYMSPEQVRGREVDARSDIFSFGTIAYEMLSGKRAFDGDSSVETMNAILKEEPPDLDTEKLHVSPGLDRIIRHCLEKDAAQRFQSARDLAFDLRTLTHASSTSAASAKAVTQARRFSAGRSWAVWAALVIVATTAIVATTLSLRSQSTWEYTAITFRRGAVVAARFAADNKTVLYSAEWGGHDAEVFSTAIDNPESRTLALGASELLAVSSAGELAILRNPAVLEAGFQRIGTLARISMAAGGAPRDVVENVTSADWSPDGSKLAVARRTDNVSTIEYPVGNVVYRGAPGTWFGNLRVSHGGDEIAFAQHPIAGDDRGVLIIIGLDGAVHYTSTVWDGFQGLAWTRDGELVVSHVPVAHPQERDVYVLSRARKERLLVSAPGEIILHDVNADGALLLTVRSRTRSISSLVNGKEHGLDWLDRPVLADLSNDGTTILFHEGGKAGGTYGKVFTRKVDGSPAVQLSDGFGLSISPDKRWAAVFVATTPPLVRLVPTGVGNAHDLKPSMDLQNVATLLFTSDSTHLLWTGPNKNGQPQTFETDLNGEHAEAHTPPGTMVIGVATNGCCEGRVTGNRGFIWHKESGVLEPVNVDFAAEAVGASSDMQTIYFAQREGRSAKIWAVNAKSGAKTLIAELHPQDPTGLVGIEGIRVSSDGKTVAYGVVREVSDLYVASTTSSGDRN